jgi:hypothetical protein
VRSQFPKNASAPALGDYRQSFGYRLAQARGMIEVIV